MWQYILIGNLVAMEALLGWRQANCAITQLYESILTLKGLRGGDFDPLRFLLDKSKTR